MNEKFSVENQFQLYLKRVDLGETKMTIVQKTVMRDTFFGAFGQALVLLRDDLPKDEDHAIIILQDLMEQIAKYYLERAKNG